MTIEMQADRRIYTCSYGEFKAEMGVPVRSSVGVPKWFKHPVSVGTSVAPWGMLKILDPVEFEEKYTKRLDEKRKEVEAQIIGLLGDTRDPLVFLCWEKLSTGKWCHRTNFGRWVEERYGIQVQELGSTLERPATILPLKPDAQGGLF